MAYEIRFLPRAVRQLRRLPQQKRSRIERQITRLADAPRQSGSQALHNAPFFRIRVGQFRVIYRIQDAELIVLVVRVGHRRDVHERLDDL
jgi:mRNA interferase RelE/StbE